MEKVQVNVAVVSGYLVNALVRLVEERKELMCMEYTGCPRRNVPDFGRVVLMLNYTDITQNT